MIGGEHEVNDLTEYSGTVTLPVLQDTTEALVEADYGAAKWYFYLSDKEGNLQYVHYELDLDSERERFLTEIQTLAGTATSTTEAK